MKITATIITLNEERKIVRAIESLRCCDEILILDSGSTDRTVELAGNLGARVIEAGWRGYAGQKNWATCKTASCILPAIRFPSISERWTGTQRWRQRNWCRAK